MKSKSFTENTNEKIGEVGKSSTKNNSTKEVINVTEEKITSKKDKGEGRVEIWQICLSIALTSALIALLIRKFFIR